MVVIITGANGQLGKSLQLVAKNKPYVQFHFLTSQDLDITNLSDVEAIFNQIKPDYCINAAAYTAVDKAESDGENAAKVNVIGPQNLAIACKNSNTVLIHISTDFVFDGNSKTPYTEEDVTHPISVYGATKLEGEKAIQLVLEQCFIIRTSWVYSQFGNNFMKTMLRLAKERSSISVVNDQMGSPTNAVDLAHAIVTIVESHENSPLKNNYGIYNFSNEGCCSWYDFAQKIFEVNAVSIDLYPIPTSSFPTPAKRPSYSVLDKSKIKKTFNITISSWEESLKETI